MVLADSSGCQKCERKIKKIFCKLKVINRQHEKYRYTKAVFFETSIIIVGISISFWISEVQKDIENQNKEQKLLKNQIKKETQLNSQVLINMEIQKRKQEIENIKQTLSQ